MKQSVVAISFSNLALDNRVQRQLSVLVEAGYDVIAVGEVDPGLDGVSFQSIGPRWSGGRREKGRVAANLLLGRSEEANRKMSQVQRLAQILDQSQFDLLIVNDIDPLPTAYCYRKEAKLLLDAHEYAPREFDESLKWRLLWQRYKTDLCARYLHKVDAMTTVSPGLADEYRRQFGVDASLILNASTYRDLSPQPVRDEAIRLVHVGGANPARKIEAMMEAVQRLDDRFSLDLYLLASEGDQSYLAQLGRIAEQSSRIRLLDPIPPQEIPERLNSYDVGIFLLPPTPFNYLHALPNKLFDYIQARLAVAVGPSPSMAELVEKSGCGVVSRGFSVDEFCQALSQLTVGEITKYKQQAARTAQSLHYEEEGRKLIALCQRVLGNKRVR